MNRLSHNQYIVFTMDKYGSVKRTRFPLEEVVDAVGLFDELEKGTSNATILGIVFGDGFQKTLMVGKHGKQLSAVRYAPEIPIATPLEPIFM